MSHALTRTATATDPAQPWLSGMTRILSASASGLPQPSLLLMVIQNEPSGPRVTPRSRPHSPPDSAQSARPVFRPSPAAQPTLLLRLVLGLQPAD
jgi:hypothetical protein